jgi:hypothetical protein
MDSKTCKIFRMNTSCFFSAGQGLLLEETKAISIPEKKALSIKQYYNTNFHRVWFISGYAVY